VLAIISMRFLCRPPPDLDLAASLRTGVATSGCYARNAKSPDSTRCEGSAHADHHASSWSVRRSLVEPRPQECLSRDDCLHHRLPEGSLTRKQTRRDALISGKVNASAAPVGRVRAPQRRCGLSPQVPVSPERGAVCPSGPSPRRSKSWT
jgi:hypothetical protein